MDRKKLLSVLLTSAMTAFWACGEGDIVKVTDEDEMVASKSDPKSKNVISDEEFLQYYIDYCNSKEGRKKGCKAELASSSSEKSSSSGKSSSSAKSSSSKGSSSSSKGGSSSSSSPKVSGKCQLLKADVVHVGEEVIWRYLPDDNTLEEARFEWNLGDETNIEIGDGDISGTGLPEISVSYKAPGDVTGPSLTFADVEFKCKDSFKVYEKGVDPTSSSSVSSSSKAESSSSAKSSSSSTPKGYCAVSKHEIEIGESVDWYIVDADSVELEGPYNWFDLGTPDENIVEGVKKGNGSTRVTVTYTESGTVVPMGVWCSKNQSIDCSRNELDEDDFKPLLVVKDKAESSSSSEEVSDESSSSKEQKSSSSKAKSSSSSFDPGIIDI